MDCVLRYWHEKCVHDCPACCNIKESELFDTGLAKRVEEIERNLADVVTVLGGLNKSAPGEPAKLIVAGEAVKILGELATRIGVTL